MTNNAVQEYIKEIANLFIDCIIDFQSVKIYVTNIDIFLHNNLTIDDCAYGITVNDFYDIPTAIIKEKLYLGSKPYYELSIRFGFIEILIVGGFYVEQQFPLLFLGFSLSFWAYGAISSASIYISNDSTKKHTQVLVF